MQFPHLVSFQSLGGKDVEVEVQDPHEASACITLAGKGTSLLLPHDLSTDTVVCVGMVGWRVSHLQIGMKALPFHWVLDNHLKGREGIILQWHKGKNLASHLGFVDESGSRILDIWQ